MKLILLFDNDKLDNQYREYTLSQEVDECLRKGGRVTVTFCHPSHGEVMITRVEPAESPK